jgi:hypothetical protein
MGVWHGSFAARFEETGAMTRDAFFLDISRLMGVCIQFLDNHLLSIYQPKIAVPKPIDVFEVTRPTHYGNVYKVQFLCQFG